MEQEVGVQDQGLHRGPVPWSCRVVMCESTRMEWKGGGEDSVAHECGGDGTMEGYVMRVRPGVEEGGIKWHMNTV